MKRSAVLLLLAFAASPAWPAEIGIGSAAPKFTLLNAADGKSYSYVPDKGKVSVVVFTCNHCPYSKAFEDRLVELGKTYKKQGVEFVAVNPNDDVAYPDETMARMKSRATGKAYPFPYLKDGDSKVAGSYGARVTPHVFVVDGQGKVRYQGYVDDSAKPGERTHAGLSDAVNALLAKKSVAKPTTRAFGCSIKWKKGA